MPQEDVQWPSEEQKHDDANGQEASEQHNQDSAKTINDVMPVSVNANEEAKSSPSTSSDTSLSDTHVSEQSSNHNVTKEPQKGNKMPKVKKFSPHYAVEAVLVVVVIVLAVTTVVFHNDKTNLQKQVNSESTASSSTAKETQAIVNKVSKLMVLPTGETPTIVEVSNASQAKKESPFFATSQDGDDALLYIKSGEAILYRPSTDKVIKVAPITYNSASSASSTSAASTTTK